MDRQLTPQDRQAIEAIAQGVSLQTLVSGLVTAADPDAALEAAREATGQDEPSESAVAQARQQLLEAAAKPFAANPELGQLLVDIRRSYEQTIDAVSIDAVIEAGFSDGQAGVLVQSFREFIEENRDEITALQVLYERPYRQRLSYADIKALADALQAPPRSWTTDRLWQAYRQLDQSKVRGSGQRALADIVSLVRFAVGEADELAPFAAQVHERFQGWLDMQETACDSTTSTTSPFRFSMSTWPAKDSFAACPFPLRANSASGSVVDTWVALERRSPRKSFHGVRPPAPGWRVPLLVPRPDALEGGPRLQQGPVHAEVLLRQQALPPRFAHHRPEEPARHLMRQQPGPVLGERRLVEGTAPDVQVEEPPEEHVRSAVRRTGAPSARSRARSASSPSAGVRAARRAGLPWRTCG